jgi:hypothetical protein
LERLAPQLPYTIGEILAHVSFRLDVYEKAINRQTPMGTVIELEFTSDGMMNWDYFENELGLIHPRL